MKKMDVILRKCKSLSTKIRRSNSYTSLRPSKSNREETLIWEHEEEEEEEEEEGTQISNEREGKTIVFVGSSRRPYVISSQHLDHPLLNSLIERSRLNNEEDISVKCEVVLFDHLLWMMENANLDADVDASAFKELAELYVF